MFGRRDYLPAFGRWTTRDPIAEAGGLNLYGFVGNGPVNAIDPLGMDVWSEIGEPVRHTQNGNEYWKVRITINVSGADTVAHGWVADLADWCEGATPLDSRTYYVLYRYSDNAASRAHAALFARGYAEDMVGLAQQGALADKFREGTALAVSTAVGMVTAQAGSAAIAAGAPGLLGSTAGTMAAGSLLGATSSFAGATSAELATGATISAAVESGVRSAELGAILGGAFSAAGRAGAGTAPTRSPTPTAPPAARTCAGGVAPAGEFSILDWSGYPAGLPRPQGPFRLLQGTEYQAARASADAANRAMHAGDSSLRGLHIHDIHPVKFGGSPTDAANKIPLSPSEHATVTTWWNRLMGSIGEY